MQVSRNTFTPSTRPHLRGTGIADTRNDLTGYTIVQAESHEAAAKLFQNHPHFTMFPGNGVEIMECLPIPGM